MRAVVAERIAGIARLRQRLQGVPLGCGRPIWVDDPSFDIANHVSETVCPSPGDRDAIFSVVAEVVSRPLSRERPMWSATLITGLNEDAVALVLMFHHVMADGLGGLAVLADLVDGAPPRPVPAGRTAAVARRLGNQVGVMLVDVSVGTGTPGERMKAIASATGARKQGTSGASAALLAPAFRVLAALRLLAWLTRHQRLVTTFVTNLRGPEQHVALLGSIVTEIIPVNAVSGNVRVAFGVFSYAGALNVTVVADSGFADDLAHLVALLEIELDGISALTDGCED